MAGLHKKPGMISSRNEFSSARTGSIEGVGLIQTRVWTFASEAFLVAGSGRRKEVDKHDRVGWPAPAMWEAVQNVQNVSLIARERRDGVPCSAWACFVEDCRQPLAGYGARPRPAWLSFTLTLPSLSLSPSDVV
jgi:hypothetical protein